MTQNLGAKRSTWNGLRGKGPAPDLDKLSKISTRSPWTLTSPLIFAVAGPAQNIAKISSSFRGPIFRFSLYFSLLFGNLSLETGSNPTASSASQSGLCKILNKCYEEARRWRPSCLRWGASVSQIGWSVGPLCRKSPRIFGIVPVLWRNRAETGLDCTVWPGCQYWPSELPDFTNQI